MCTTLISDATYPRVLGRLGVVLPSVPYICFQVGLASQQLQKAFQERDMEGKSPCGLIMNFDLWAVPGDCSAHALRACILCLHKGMLHCILHVGIFTVRVGMLCVHMSCWHFHTVFFSYMMACCT